jgi:hypothetical protein
VKWPELDLADDVSKAPICRTQPIGRILSVVARLRQPSRIGLRLNDFQSAAGRTVSFHRFRTESFQPCCSASVLAEAASLAAVDHW